MKIRSVTCFVTVGENVSSAQLRQAGDLANATRELAPRDGYEVQSTRLAVQPLDRILRSLSPPEFAWSFETAFHEAGFDYGALSAESETLLGSLALLVRRTESVFASARIAARGIGINLDAVRMAANVIHELAHTTPEGLGNFRFAAAANVPPGVPFFPVAYHEGNSPKFAFATEAADLAVAAFSRAHDLEEARSLLVQSMEYHGGRLSTIGEELGRKYDIHFGGIDFSLAPYPEQGRSLATAMERLTGVKFGMRGTLFSAAFLTECLRAANFPRAGFSGLMLPMMEDWTMAARSQDDLFSIDSLLLYSTVCGTGLDTIPLAGDSTQDAIAALLLDLSALAMRLDKPLTARLIPVPGIGAGETTRFAFEYFSNAKVFDLSSNVPLKIFDANRKVSINDDG